VGVLFPAFSLSLTQGSDRTGLLLSRGIKYIFLALFPIALVLVALAPEGLRLWVGPAFAANGTSVLRWITAGVFLVSLATLPFVLIQSAGRPDITAKLQFAELPFYLAALWLLTRKFGIEGTAIAWTGRTVVDGILLFICLHRLIRLKPRFLVNVAITTASALAVLYLASIPSTFALRAAFLAVALLAFGYGTWCWGLGPSERVFFLRNKASVPVSVRG
jgi:O-antigen/teichoic acid export membrane protein